MNQGEDFKQAIRTRSFTQAQAAAKLKISRQTLHNYFKKEILDDAFVQKVNEVLGVFMEFQRNPTADFMSGPGEPDRFWEIIEAQRELISSQREEIQRLLREKHKPPLEMGKTGGRNT